MDLKKLLAGLKPLPAGTVVVFVLGGPGAGKGTQCGKLNALGFEHLSAGDLLRAERNRQDSPYGELINQIIKDGKIVPMEITIKLLHTAMEQSSSSRFLIDGFPRALDQGLAFEKQVCESSFVLFFDCSEDEMLARLMKRAETSGRVDDNEDSIRKRFKTFRETSYPAIEYYGGLGKVRKVNCSRSIEEVFADTTKIIKEFFKN